MKRLITVDNLSKSFALHSSKFDRLKYALGINKKTTNIHNALSSINFEVNTGDTIGIIGRNGSGKSTLLKLISGIITPTTGAVSTSGRIQALIELGAGFNPDLTGADNIKFYGAIMGMATKEIEQNFDRIVTFAEIGKFINQPIKFYSSGMKSRLAFSVAIHTSPEVLIVDEVLSVGDAYFRQKCIDRLHQMLDSGLTLIYVSHNIGEIKTLCEKVLYLKDGNQIDFGPAESVCNLYQIGIEQPKGASNATAPDWPKATHQGTNLLEVTTIKRDEGSFGDENFPERVSERSGNGALQIVDVSLCNPSGVKLKSVQSGTTTRAVIDIIANKNIPAKTAFGLLIRDSLGVDICSINSDHADFYLPAMKKEEKYKLEIEIFLPLVAGVYSISFGLKPDPDQNTFYDRCFNALIFEIERPPHQKITGGIFYHRAKKYTLKRVL